MAKRKSTTSKTTGYTYKGGAHIHGVPARDLSAAEYKIYAEVIEAQQALTNTVLYEPFTVAAAEEEG